MAYYAEYLPRIQLISVVIEYEDSLSQIQGISFLGSEVLIIKLKEDSRAIKLPIAIEGTPKITKLNQTKDCLCIVISVPGEKYKDTQPFNTLQTEWSCIDLKNKAPKDGSFYEFSFRCINCDNEIIDSKQYKFKDMPSEYWRELMDIWHCHKPHTEKEGGKNYNGQLLGSSKDILVGPYYLVMNGQDVEEFELRKGNCICGHNLGSIESEGFKVFKWNLLLQYGANRETYPLWLYPYGIMMDKINLSAVRKFRFSSGQHGLFIWILSIGVDICLNGKVYSESLKVLYHFNEVEDLMENIEQVDVSENQFQSLKDHLSDCTMFLPHSRREEVFKEGEKEVHYKIAFLDAKDHS